MARLTKWESGCPLTWASLWMGDCRLWHAACKHVLHPAIGASNWNGQGKPRRGVVVDGRGGAPRVRTYRCSRAQTRRSAGDRTLRSAAMLAPTLWRNAGGHIGPPVAFDAGAGSHARAQPTQVAPDTGPMHLTRATHHLREATMPRYCDTTRWPRTLRHSRADGANT